MVDDPHRVSGIQVQRGLLAELDAVRHDIHVQRHGGVRNNMHRHILAVRDRSLDGALVGDPVGIAETLVVYDVLTLHAPEIAAVDNGFDVAVEEFEIIVSQLRHFFPRLDAPGPLRDRTVFILKILWLL